MWGSGVTREELKAVFADTMQWCAEDDFLKAVTAGTKENTIRYGKDEIIDISNAKADKLGEISLSINRAQIEFWNLNEDYPKSRIVVVNNLPYRNIEKGIKVGYSTQPVPLFTYSTLYPSMDEAWMDAKNKNLDMEAVIYSPDVAIIKNKNICPERLENKEEWFFVDVISCFLPNAKYEGKYIYDCLYAEEEIREIHRVKLERIVRAAIANEAYFLVFGTSGCIAKRDEPKIVAEVYASVLGSYANHFTEVILASDRSHGHESSIDAAVHLEMIMDHTATMKKMC